MYTSYDVEKHRPHVWNTLGLRSYQRKVQADVISQKNSDNMSLLLLHNNE